MWHNHQFLLGHGRQARSDGSGQIHVRDFFDRRWFAFYNALFLACFAL